MPKILFIANRIIIYCLARGKQAWASAAVNQPGYSLQPGRWEITSNSSLAGGLESGNG
ncbi:MAG: hypothetical protein QXN75_04735 [Thermoproteota archaeon]|nr:hypothetical protein [Candidatus Brockarchaeota archaeon]